jgi:EAL domain-containing protein (putative c-di-GMP-specific phosphodiesterase class I)
MLRCAIQIDEATSSDNESVLVPSIYPLAGPLEPWVREAVDRGVPESQLELQYQPVVRLDGSGVYGAETFLRWRHPERGVLRAGQWIPYAVRSGAAVSLCVAVLPAWAACARRLPGLVLSFNVGGQDLADARYMATILTVADEGAAGLAVEVPYLQFHPGAVGASASQLGWIEPADLDARLASLQAVGVSVWMDNFGCGGVDDETAAVGPTVDVVKLDMSLLGWKRGRLTALVERLHDHGKVVLVEGVASAAHERLAVETGMDLASGFRYAPSLPEEQFVEYLES